MPEKPDEDYALRYVYEAMKYKPGASHREIRREVRRKLKAEGYGAGWIWVVIRIIAALLPLLVQRPKS
jgi:hypothetical protein